ncbi:MoaD/ThiS family protein [bacterium]|nr:MoaD/ThiS family protein [bacterium]
MGIKIKIEIFGALMKPKGQDNFEYETENTLISEILAELKYRKEHVKYIIASVNGQTVQHVERVNDGDLLRLTTLVGGG